MEDTLNIKLYSFTLDCKDPHALAAFYATLLSWEIPFFNEECALVCPPGTKQGGYPCITFQQNPAYLPPVWPEELAMQQQMAHLDFVVNDLQKATAYAIQCGATIAQQQFSDNWTVLFDPAGHPFCLCFMKHIVDSPDFSLL